MISHGKSEINATCTFCTHQLAMGSGSSTAKKQQRYIAAVLIIQKIARRRLAVRRRYFLREERLQNDVLSQLIVPEESKKERIRIFRIQNGAAVAIQVCLQKLPWCLSLMLAIDLSLWLGLFLRRAI